MLILNFRNDFFTKLTDITRATNFRELIAANDKNLEAKINIRITKQKYLQNYTLQFESPKNIIFKLIGTVAVGLWLCMCMCICIGPFSSDIYSHLKPRYEIWTCFAIKINNPQWLYPTSTPTWTYHLAVF